MTVYTRGKKWRIDPVESPLQMHKFGEHYGTHVDTRKMKIITLTDVMQAAARVEEYDFLIYETYGIIYVCEILL